MDHAQQEGWGGGNLAVEANALGPEFGSEERLVDTDDIGDDGRVPPSPKADPIPTTYSTTSKMFFIFWH